MTNKELIKLSKENILGKHKGLYIARYKALFGNTPACAGCTFSKDFKKFKERVNGSAPMVARPQTPKEMSGYKLSNKYSSDILSYQKDGRVVRVYGREITDEFAKEFLKHGHKSILEKRRAMFESLPEKKAKAEAPKKVKVSKKKKTDETKSEAN